MKKIIGVLLFITIIFTLVYIKKKIGFLEIAQYQIEKSLKKKFPDLRIITSEIKQNKQNDLLNFAIDEINVKYQKQIFTINDIDFSFTDNFFLAYLFPFFFKDSLQKITISFEITNNGLKAKFKCYNNLKNLSCSAHTQAKNSKFLLEFINKDIKFSQLESEIDFDLNIQNNLKIVKLDISGQIGQIQINDETILPKAVIMDNVNFKTKIENDKIHSQLLSFIDEKSLLIQSKVSDFIFLKKPKEIDLNIFIEEVKVKNLEKLWPTILAKQKIQSWIKNHISSETLMKNANLQMNFEKNLDNFALKSLRANFAIENSDINYNKNYPQIKNAKAKAYFTQNDMNIIISEGEVLNSKVTSGKVSIPKFSSDNTILGIDLEIQGLAEDLLQHIDYKNPYNKNLKNFYNGNSITDLKIALNLSKKEITLKDSSIAIKSKISNSDTNIIEGDSWFKIENKKGKEDFEIQIKSTKKLKAFSLIYENNPINQISLNVLSKNNKIYLSNIKTNDKHFFSSAVFNKKTKNIEYFDISNQNLNFTSEYSNNKISLFFNTSYLNPKYIFNLQNLISKKNNEILKYNIDLQIGKIPLRKNREINNLSIKINCDKAICKNSLIKFDEKGLEKMKISIKKNPNKSNSAISGNIHDLSIISAFTDNDFQITQGSLQLLGTLSYDNKFIINGKVKQTSDIGFKENNKSKKQKFKKLIIDFSLEDKILQIKNMIFANNKVGFLTTGSINLAKNSVNLEGLYTPAYVINKNFLNKIPLLGKILSGSDNGGLFAIKYKYYKKDRNTTGVLSKNPLSIITPGILRNLIFWN